MDVTWFTVLSVAVICVTGTHVINSDIQADWTKPPHDLNVICYVATWANYRIKPSDFFIDNIDPTLCTHLMYSFVGLDNETYTIKHLDTWADLDADEGGRGFMRQMTGLRVEHPHLKVLLAIGGFDEGSVKYSEMASSIIKRKRFIDSAVKMIKKFEFDGLDLDWEYPGERGGVPDDKENFVSLTKELRAEFDKHGWLLTSAFGANVNVMETGYDFPELAKYLDMFNIMAYDYHGAFDNLTGSNAPLYNQYDMFSVMDTLTYLFENGAPMKKVMLGLPMYGQTFVLDEPGVEGANVLGAPCNNTGFPGNYTQAPGFMGYHEICLVLNDTAWQYYWDNVTGTPYLINEEKLVSYDDEKSITMKVDYAVRFGLGGLMLWSIDTDDFRGDCGATTFPLLRRLSNAVVETLEDMGTETTTTDPTATTTPTTVESTTAVTPTTTDPSTGWSKPQHNLNVVCYVSTWANYRVEPADFLINNIDSTLCTHLIYSFAGLDNETFTIVSLDPWIDLDESEGGRDKTGLYRQMTGLKVKHPHLKVLLAIGGFDEGSEKYSEMASSSIRRKLFTIGAASFVQKYGFDGLDLDWEYPGERGGAPEDKENFVALVKELRTEFDKHDLLLTAAFHAAVNVIETAYDIQALGEHLDLLNIMAYDYHGSFDNFTGSNAPLYKQDDMFSVMDTLDYLSELGAPMEKVMLGLPMYGHTFLMDDPSAEGSQEFGAPCDNEGFPGEYTETKGFMGYNEICLQRQDSRWKQFWDNATGTPYMIDKEKLISFDDEISITMKVDYAVRFGLGGLMLWSIDTDDFRGDCGTTTFPLLRRLNNAVVETLEDMGTETTTTDPTATTTPTTVESTTAVTPTTTDPSTGWSKPPHNLNVVCYVSTWANYRVKPSDYFIDNIDPTLCTHLIYAFAGLDNETYTIKSLDPWTDVEPEEGGRGSFMNMTRLRNEHKHLTILLAIGGFDEGSAKYSELSASPTKRKAFVTSVLKMLLKYEFDGLDLDWEYPGERGGVPEDKENFVELVKDLRVAFDKYGFILSAAFHAAVNVIETAYDIPALGEHLDLLNIMAYDYHGSFDNFTGSNAPLYKQDDMFSVTDTLEYLYELGAPMEKIMLGLPMYGHTFLMDDPEAEGSQELGAPCDNLGFPGAYTKTDGFMGFHEICLEVQDGKWKRYWDNGTGTPYLINKEKLISYDDAQSIALKVDYAVRFGIGGLMLWSIDTDDFRGDCGGGRYPLLKTISMQVQETILDIENGVNATSTSTSTSTSTTVASTPSTTATPTTSSILTSSTTAPSTVTTVATTTEAPNGSSLITAASITSLLSIYLFTISLR